MSLLLWSGGCDSTFVLAEMLAAKKDVRTISIVQSQFWHNEQQRLARKLIVGHFKRRKIVWPHIEVVIQHKYPFDHRGHIQMNGVLPAIWLGIATQYLAKDEDLAIGYIKGDNAIHWLEHIRESFKWLQRLAFRNGSLLLPVEWHSKAMILAGLKKHKLLRKCWWCEGLAGSGIKGSRKMRQVSALHDAQDGGVGTQESARLQTARRLRQSEPRAVVWQWHGGG